MKRRGQVAVFIILAIIIVLSFLLLYFVNKPIVGTEQPKQSFKLPLEAKPIQDYIELKTQQLLMQAVINLGQHGGYVNPLALPKPDNVKQPTESSVLKPFRSSNRYYPYWYFMSSPNTCQANCQFSTLMPSLKSKYETNRPFNDMSIEAQLDNYIEDRLLKLDFSHFKTQGYSIKAKGFPIVTTSIEEDRVVANVKLPLQIVKGDTTVQLSSFSTSVKSKLKQAYELAARITKQEKDRHFLEQQVINLLSVYSDVEKERLPPFSRRIEFGGNPVYWKLDDVRANLARDVLSKISAIRVEGISGQPEKGLLSGAVVYAGSDKFKDAEVSFIFPDTLPYYLEINGRETGFIGPTMLSQNLMFLTIMLQQYAFWYDVSFPVLVRIKLPKGLGDSDYSFWFALEGNVRNNQPAAVSSEQVIANQTMFCEDNQRLSGNIAIKTRTTRGSAVGNVDLYYDCGGHSCYIGSTDEHGVLIAKLPVCLGGKIKAIKHGYITEPVQFDSYLGKAETVIVGLEKALLFDIDAKKLVFEPSLGAFGSYVWPHQIASFRSLGYRPKVQDLEDNETLFVIFKRVGDISYEFPIQIVHGKETPQVYLVPGKYRIDMMLIKNKKLIIPKHECGLLAIGCVEMNRTEFDTAQLGGGVIDAKTGYFELKPSDVSKSRIMLYAVYLDMFKIPENERKPKDLLALSKINDYSIYFKKYKPMLS